MNFSRVANTSILVLVSAGVPCAALAVNSGISAAPAPLAGAGFIYLVAAGIAGSAIYAGRKFRAQKRSRQSGEHKPGSRP